MGETLGFIEPVGDMGEVTLPPTGRRDARRPRASRALRRAVVIPVLLAITVAIAAACTEGPSVTTAADPDMAPRVAVADDPAPASTSSSTSESTTSSTTTTSTTTTSTTTSTTTPSSTTSETAPPSATTSAQASTTADLAANSVEFVNQRRAEHGLAALEVDPALAGMAERWARQMASDGRLRHNPRLQQEAPSAYGGVGENVAYSSQPAGINGMWWDSDGHRANILRSSYSAIGVAFVADSHGTYWAVQVFAG